MGGSSADGDVARLSELDTLRQAAPASSVGAGLLDRVRSYRCTASHRSRKPWHSAKSWSGEGNMCVLHAGQAR